MYWSERLDLSFSHGGGAAAIPQEKHEKKDMWMAAAWASLRFDEPDPTLPVPGSAWGKYRIEALLEEGGMGRVYRAWDVSLRRPVALKCLRAEDPRAVKRLSREARAQARVSHEHVCKIYETGEIHGHPYITMQLIEGRTLKEAAASMTLEQKVRVMMQVAFGVEAAHRKGLVHRDLKPDNILIERPELGEMRPYLVDFGIARDPEDTHLTGTGVVVGSLPYMAPERLEGAPLDPRMDIWSLGATLYEMLTGSPPFGNLSRPEILRRILRENATPVSQRVPGIARDLDAVVMKCLERQPDLRYLSAGLLARDLESFLAGQPVVARPVSWWWKPFRRPRRGLRAAAVVLIALSAAAVGLGMGMQAEEVLHGDPAAASGIGNGELQSRRLENEVRMAFLLPLDEVHPARRAALARLQGDVLRTLGDRERKRGEYQKALAAYDEAGQAYGLALAVDGAAPAVLAAECRRARGVVDSRHALGMPLVEARTRVEAACGRLDPGSAGAPPVHPSS